MTAHCESEVPRERLAVVLFDAVGTLLYPDPPVAETYFAAGQLVGSRFSLTEVSQRFRAALRQHWSPPSGSQAGETSEQREQERWRAIVADVFTDVGERQEELFQNLWQHFADSRHWRLFDDVAMTWQELEAAGICVGVASNFDDRLVAILRDLLPPAVTSRLFVSSQLGFTKPSLSFFRAIEQRLQLAPEQILLIGDDPTNDFAAATTAGWQARWLVRDSHSPPAPHIIRSLREVPKMLSNGAP